VHTQAAPAEVEVAVTDRGELALAKAHQEEELQRNAVAQLGLDGDDPCHVLGSEELTFDIAEPQRADRNDRVPAGA